MADNQVSQADQAASSAWDAPGVQPDYDQVLIDVAPTAMNTASTALGNLAKDVSDSTGRIKTTLDALVLDTWKGKSQEEAQDMSNLWDQVMGRLFGSKDKPDDGVLNALANGVDTASGNFTKAEAGLTDLFNHFASGLQGSADPQPLVDVMDTNKTAITADYP